MCVCVCVCTQYAYIYGDDDCGWIENLSSEGKKILRSKLRFVEKKSVCRVRFVPLTRRSLVQASNSRRASLFLSFAVFRMPCCVFIAPPRFGFRGNFRSIPHEICNIFGVFIVLRNLPLNHVHTSLYELTIALLQSWYIGLGIGIRSFIYIYLYTHIAYYYTGAGALYESSTTGHRRGITRKSRLLYGGEVKRGRQEIYYFFAIINTGIN